MVIVNPSNYYVTSKVWLHPASTSGTYAAIRSLLAADTIAGPKVAYSAIAMVRHLRACQAWPPLTLEIVR